VYPSAARAGYGREKGDGEGRSPVYIAACFGHVECIRVLHELGAEINKCTTNDVSPVYVAAKNNHVECILVLRELGADINKCFTGGASPVCIAAQNGDVECLRLLSELGANVQPLLWITQFTVHVTNIVQIQLDVRSFLAATGLSQSPHQYTLYSLVQLAAYYLQRRHYADQQLQDIVDKDDFASRFAAVVQDNRLIVPRFEVAAAKASTTPAQRLLVLLAARTAIDAAVAHAAEEAKPIDVALVADVMNLLMSCDTVRDMFSLRPTCKLTYRRSFPAPSHPLLELSTSVVEDFVGGSGSRQVAFENIKRSLALHAQATPAAATVEE
jgi:hypothetical protein